jgi:hypothetical protein
MATNLKTNMSGFIVASPKVAALLLRAFSANFAEQRNKMIGYVGSLGERDLYVDYWTEDDYILIGLNSKEELKGVFFSPYDMSVTYSTKAQSGANIVRVNNRFAITRNPLVNDGVNDSILAQMEMEIGVQVGILNTIRGLQIHLTISVTIRQVPLHQHILYHQMFGIFVFHLQ